MRPTTRNGSSSGGNQIDLCRSLRRFPSVQRAGSPPSSTASERRRRKDSGHCSRIRIGEGAWNRRGLVIGHVQSGKTANYLGVIAKAADAGYKFIIVIAGIHNNLRKQTQRAHGRRFIGRSSDPETECDRRWAGQDYPHPVTLTNINDGLQQEHGRQERLPKMNDFNKPIILVIKKNVTTLDGSPQLA